MFPRQGVIDLPSRQINDFSQKKETEKIELVSRPDIIDANTYMISFLCVVQFSSHAKFFEFRSQKTKCYSQDIDCRRSSLVAKPRKVAKNLLKDKVMKKEQVSIDSSANKYDLTIPVLHILLR